MEMMPFHVHCARPAFEPLPIAHVPLPTFGQAFTHDWRDGLQTMAGPLCTLRELTREDAP